MIFTNVKKIDQAILFALLGYMWFIFTTKLDVHFNVIILLLLLSAFIYDFKANEKTTEIETDPNLSKTQKEQLIQSQTNYRIYFILLILAVTAVGTTFYINKKSIQYGGGEFDVVKFIFY
ncbi:MAG: hypothetical protein Hyperionvirus17_40 [Hyperionvirus sp.]|uniref:Uncharacterized protein n=1 Tax=Hyperionvirus sp. TaxID=2487770 RepID=A0A3G5AA44_9VIRU|nr:MAG: hypothetical protein Hyperionvirus17_40 [Hyperionvirus sp.]